MKTQSNGLFKRLVSKLATRALVYAGIPLRDPALYDLFGMRMTQAGVHVDENTALNFSAYYSGVNLIASTIAMLELAVVDVDDKGQETVSTEAIGTEFFRDGPNPNMTPQCFMELVQTQVLTWGNGYIFIERDGFNVVDNGRDYINEGLPKALWPVMADQVLPDYDEDGFKVYKFTAKFPGETSMVYRAEDIVHIPAFGFDGLRGMSVVKAAKESIALGLATEKFGASHFGNNAIPGGIITHPSELSEKAKSNIVAEVEDKVKGPFRARRVVVLDEGMKYTPIGIPPEDSQFLQTRQFQVKEIARWLRIPPHMLYDLENATYTNIENQGLEFLIYTLTPWLVKWIQELGLKLLTKNERRTKKFRFDFSRLLMLDTKTRFEIYNAGRNMGVYTLNDILRAEGKPLLPPQLGDTHVVPSTMKTLGAVDPSTPIDPDVMTKAIGVIKTLNRPTLQTATNILNAIMPSASNMLVNSIVLQLGRENLVTIAEDKDPRPAA